MYFAAASWDMYEKAFTVIMWQDRRIRYSHDRNIFCTKRLWRIYICKHRTTMRGETIQPDTEKLFSSRNIFHKFNELDFHFSSQTVSLNEKYHSLFQLGWPVISQWHYAEICLNYRRIEKTFRKIDSDSILDGQPLGRNAESESEKYLSTATQTSSPTPIERQRKLGMIWSRVRWESSEIFFMREQAEENT